MNEHLQALARGLVEADTVEAVASEVMRATLELFDWDAFLFSERIDGTDEFIRVLGWDTFNGKRTELDAEAFPPNPYRTVPELHRGQPLVIYNDQPEVFQPFNRFGNMDRPSATLLYAPIHYRGTLHGICSVQSYTPHRYSYADLATLALVTEIVAPALRRARAERELKAKMAQLAEANEEVRRKTTLTTAVYGIAMSLDAMHSTEELFQRVHSLVESMTGAREFVVALCSPDGTGAQISYTGGQGNLSRSPQVENLQQVLQRRELLRLDVAAGTGGMVASAFPAPTSQRSWLGVPLIADGSLLGAMAIESSTGWGSWGDDASEMVEFVASEVARALIHIRTDIALRTSEDLYRRAIACAGAVPYFRDFEKYIWTQMGEGIRDLTGYSAEEITTELWQKIVVKSIPRDELEGLSFWDAAQRVNRGEVPRWTADVLIVRRDGVWRWLSDNSVPVHNPDGSVKGMLGMLQDVTDRVNALRLHQALSRLGQLLAAAEKPREVGIAAAQVMDHVFGWDCFFVDIRDSRTGLTTSVVNYDIVNGERREFPSIFPVPTPPTETFRRVVENGALLIRDAEVSQDRPNFRNFGDQERRSESLMYVPLRGGEKEVVGILSLQSYTANRYTQDDMEMLSVLAELCGAALYRTLAEQSFHKAHARALAFGNLTHRLALVRDAREAGTIIADEADRLIGWDACYFDLYDASTNAIVQMLNMDTIDGKRVEVKGTHTSIEPTRLEKRALEHGAFVLYQDDPNQRIPELELFGDVERPSACIMVVPARVGSEVVAFFSVQSYTPRAYNEDDLTTLQALADHSAGALNRIRLEEAIRISNERFTLAAKAANDGLWDWDLASGHVHMSPRCREILGSDPNSEDRSIDEWLSRVHPADRPITDEILRNCLEGRTDHYEMEFRTAAGEGWRWVLVRGISVLSQAGAPVRLVGSVSDISTRKAAEAELVESAFYDQLTGLANRALFSDRLEQCFRRSKRDDSARFAVMFLDLDRFKAVNDTHGHLMGDLLLQSVAQRLRRQFRPADTVARMGGDEFTVLVEQYRNERDLGTIAARVISELSLPYEINGEQLRISTSIGIATSEHGYINAEEVLRDADAALYRAKEMGKARYEIFDTSMRETVVATLAMETEIERALRKGEFLLHYQPIVELRTKRIAGLEALIRWNHPTRGLVPPMEFIPIAEESPLIHELGEWVLSTACEQISAWRRDYEAARDCYVSVNVSARQFASAELGGMVKKHLTRRGLTGDALRIELTETALLKESSSIQAVLESWRSAGVRIMLDDFGTGYSSLSHLNHFSVDYLKIDRTFVSGLMQSEESQRVVRAVISLAAVLGMQVVAEGAETQEQCDLLRTLDCELVQGFYLSRPLPPESISELLRRGLAEPPKATL